MVGAPMVLLLCAVPLNGYTRLWDCEESCSKRLSRFPCLGLLKRKRLLETKAWSGENLCLKWAIAWHCPMPQELKIVSEESSYARRAARPGGVASPLYPGRNALLSTEDAFH